MSRAGQLIAAGGALCAVALAFAAPELYVPGLSLLIVGAVAPAWVRLAAVGVRLRLRAPGGAVQEGDRLTLHLQVRRGWCPVPGASLVLASPAQVVALPRRRDQGAAAASVLMYRRGLHELGPLILTIRDPLGICSREIRSDAGEVLVLPRVHAMSAGGLGGLDGDLRHRALAPRAANEIDSLRPYRPGAPASRIHWPTVARTGELLEHRLVADADERPLVILDVGAAESEDSLDRALRAAASLCVHLARRGGCGLLLPGDRRAAAIEADLRAWPAQHARLALIAPAGEGLAGRRAPARRAPRGGLVIQVTAATPDHAALLAGSWRLGPHPFPHVPVAFSVAGCDAQLVPAAVMARSA